MTGERFVFPVFATVQVKLAGSFAMMVWLAGSFLTRIAGLQDTTVTWAVAFHCTVFPSMGEYAWALTKFV